MPEEATRTAPDAAGPAPATPPGSPPGPPLSGPDVAGLVAKESRKAVEKLLQEAGITPGTEPGGQLKDYKKWLQGQQDALAAARDETARLTQDLAAEQHRRQTLERQLAALGRGVPPERLAAYGRLAESYLPEAGDFDQALDAALRDFPLAAAPPERRGSAGSGANPGQTSGGGESQPLLGEQLARQQLARLNRWNQKQGG